MKQKATCPSCHKSINVPLEAFGKKVRCPGCSAPFTVSVSLSPENVPTEADTYSLREDAPQPVFAKRVKSKPRHDSGFDSSVEHEFQPRGKSSLLLISAAVAILLLGLGGLSAIIYFFVIDRSKPEVVKSNTEP